MELIWDIILFIVYGFMLLVSLIAIIRPIIEFLKDL